MLFDISVIICAYSEARWQLLLAAVDSVRCQTVQPREIILVIDHNPALVTRARLTLPDVLVAENREGRGISGARNTAIALARGSVLVFLDDDACAEPDWLEHLLAGYADPRVMGVGGGIEPNWESPRPAWFPAEFGWVVGCSYVGLPQTAAAVRNLIGANLSVRRDVLEVLGGFRRDFGKVGVQSEPEDTDLCIRGLRQWQHGIWLYEPRAVVHHFVPAGRTDWRYFIQRCYLEGRGKASLVRNVGVHDGLETETAYVRQTLPAGFMRGLADVWRGDLTGLARSAVIVIGLGITMTGYAIGLVSRGVRPARPSATVAL